MRAILGIALIAALGATVGATGTAEGAVTVPEAAPDVAPAEATNDASPDPTPPAAVVEPVDGTTEPPAETPPTTQDASDGATPLAEEAPTPTATAPASATTSSPTSSAAVNGADASDAPDELVRLRRENERLRSLLEEARVVLAAFGAEAPEGIREILGESAGRRAREPDGAADPVAPAAAPSAAEHPTERHATASSDTDANRFAEYGVVAVGAPLFDGAIPVTTVDGRGWVDPAAHRADGDARYFIELEEARGAGSGRPPIRATITFRHVAPTSAAPLGLASIGVSGPYGTAEARPQSVATSFEGEMRIEAATFDLARIRPAVIDSLATRDATVELIGRGGVVAYRPTATEAAAVHRMVARYRLMGGTLVTDAAR